MHNTVLDCTIEEEWIHTCGSWIGISMSARADFPAKNHHESRNLSKITEVTEKIHWGINTTVTPLSILIAKLQNKKIFLTRLPFNQWFYYQFTFFLLINYYCNPLSPSQVSNSLNHSSINYTNWIYLFAGPQNNVQYHQISTRSRTYISLNYWKHKIKFKERRIFIL